MERGEGWRAGTAAGVKASWPALQARKAGNSEYGFSSDLGSVLGLVRRGEPNPAESVGEVLGEMLSIRRQKPRSSMPALAEGRQKIEPDGVDLSKINDHL